LRFASPLISGPQAARYVVEMQRVASLVVALYKSSKRGFRADASMNRQFVSYPKSGRSWIRYILHCLGVQNRIQFHHDGCEFSHPAKPQLALDFAARLEQHGDGTRIVYMRRDPRDVMVSLYFQICGRMGDVYEFDGDISAFIRDSYFGAANLIEFDRQWRELCRRGLALAVTYEECHSSIETVMRKILDWYELDASDEALRAACADATFQKMHAVERNGKFDEPWLRPRNGAAKTRRGIVGGYVDFLSAADLALFEQLSLKAGAA
jgi:Sulfotransferase domain